MANKNTRTESIVTAVFRVAFPALFSPTAFDASKPAQYSVILLLPKKSGKASEDYPEIWALMLKAVQLKWGDAPPTGLDNPIRDGDTKPDWNGFAGNFYIRAHTHDDKVKPTIVDQNAKLIADLQKSKVYGGCYMKIETCCFGWENMGKKGVSFGISAAQLVKDGDPFGAHMDEATAAKKFGVVPGGQNDPAKYGGTKPAEGVSPFTS